MTTDLIQKTWTEISWKMKTVQDFMFKKGVYAIIADGALIYIGSSGEIGLRVASHPKITAAKRNGCTSVKAYAKEVPNRIEFEKKLIHELKPPLNKRHNSANQ